MNKQTLPSKALLCVYAALVSSTGLFASAGIRAMPPSAGVPEEIATRYSAHPEPMASDEFESGELDREKWAYRTQDGDQWGVGEDYISFGKDGEAGFVAIRGDVTNGLGSGISGLHLTHFGFYSMRWRVDNLPSYFKSVWHPAVWKADKNFASGEDARSIPQTKLTVEIDFIEFYHHPSLQSHLIAWNRNGADPRIDIKKYGDSYPTTNSGWLIHGLEYHPDYFQLWEDRGDGWKKVGTRIKISAERTDKKNLNRGYATPGYWVLSNKYHWDQIKKSLGEKADPTDFLQEDSALHVDYFRYFPIRDRTPATD